MRRKEETREREWEKRRRITEREMEKRERREREKWRREREEKLRKVKLNTMVRWNGLCDVGVKQYTHGMKSDLTMKASLSNNVCSSPLS